MTLRELTEEQMSLMRMLEEEEDEQVIKDTLEAIEGEIEAKADNYAAVIAEVQSDVEKFKAEEDRLYAIRKRMENNIQRMKDALQNTMVTTGKDKIKTELHTFSLRNNPPKVIILNKDAVPFDCMKYKDPEPDLTKIKELCKAGEIDWAKLVSGKSLVIK